MPDVTAPDIARNQDDTFDLSFKVFYDLMAKRVSEILLVSSPYDAFIMEEDGRLAERIIHEYRGLNLTRPPRLTWVSTAQEALNKLARQKFDLVLTMPRLGDMEPRNLGRAIKKRFPNIPVFLLTHGVTGMPIDAPGADPDAIDKTYIWTGNTDLLLAMIKNEEDRMNVVSDTERARVRVILLVEDSPVYYSSLLPFLYKEVVSQTQAVMEESLNEEHRILRMRARPKILHALTYEDAETLFRSFQRYMLCVLSDVRFPKDRALDPEAGFSLVSMVREARPQLPLFIMSSEEKNREKAEEAGALFLNKNSPTLHTDLRAFFMQYLGFGEFIFQMPDGTEAARAANLLAMEKLLPTIPDESVHYHAVRDHFSTWLMARSEIQLAMKLKPIKVSDFSSIPEMKEYLITCLRNRRVGRQKGVIADFTSEGFDPGAEFAKIGKGSLGGKARGLAFMATRFKENPAFLEKYPHVTIGVPKTLVISTEAFEAFIRENDLKALADSDLADADIARLFLKGRLPDWLESHLRRFLIGVDYPLAVRSSSLLEDAMFQPFAGLYRTYMVANRDPDLEMRLKQLRRAIKLVYASTYYEAPWSFSRSTLHRIEEEKMAVVIQKLTGSAHGGNFYPAVSGVAQSFNFYPVGRLKAEEGIAHIALGLGKTVVDGLTALRFSPRHPQFLPQFSTVEDILKNAQRYFYALALQDDPEAFIESALKGEDPSLVSLEIAEAAEDPRHTALKRLLSLYLPQEHRIRDSGFGDGAPVLTFAGILKYGAFPLPEILSDVLEMGKEGMASPVEIEFAVNFPDSDAEKPEFALLQIRPMAMFQNRLDFEITAGDIQRAVCYSSMALGHGTRSDIQDILFVKPNGFDPARTVEIAREIGSLNKEMIQKQRRYLLIGPGRWGSADRWLGIPVAWNDISMVGSFIEDRTSRLRADPSYGSHFFHNITSLGISYLTVAEGGEDFIDWDWLLSLPAVSEIPFVRHVRPVRPLSIRVDGKKSTAVILKE